MHKHNVGNIADIVEGCVHAHARAYANACKYNRPSVHACIYVRVCVHAYMHMHVHTQMHASTTAEENAIWIGVLAEFKGRGAAFLPLCVLPEVAAHKKVSESRYCGRLDVTAVGNARQPDRVLVLKNHPLILREIQIHLFIRRWPPYHMKAPDRILDVEIVLEAPPITFEF